MLCSVSKPATCAALQRCTAGGAVVRRQHDSVSATSLLRGCWRSGLRPGARLQRRSLIVAAVADEVDEQVAAAAWLPPPPASPPAPVRAPSASPQPAAAPRQGSLLGAMALIIGSTVGAGMLALPEVTAPAGIVPTSAGLTAIWGLLTLDALLIAEVNLAALEARNSNAGRAGGSGGGEQAVGVDGSIVTLRQMAEFTLGKAGKGITLVYLMLSYSLLTAYATKAEAVLDYFAGGGLPPLAGATAFVGSIGALLYLGGTKAADSLNQGLTSVLMALFGVILTAGAAQTGLPQALLAGAPSADWSALEPAVPIMFLALVYHDLVPVIVNYLGGDRQKIRSAIVLGSIVPLTMFLSWEAVALSLLPGGLSDAASAAAGTVLQASLPLGPSGSPAAAELLPAVAGGSSSGAMLQASLHLAAGSGSAAAAVAEGAASTAGAVPVALLADGPGVIAIDPLEVFVRRSGPLIGSVVEGFSFLAVMTSFIGTTLSLSETLRTEVPPLLREVSKQLRRTAGAEVSADVSSDADELACLADSGVAASGGCYVGDWSDEVEDEGSFTADQARGVALALTLCPPLVLAAANPDSFLGALQIAGGYFMTLLYGILPPLMAWQLRSKLKQDKQPEQQQQGKQQQQPVPVFQQQQQASWWRQQLQHHEEMVPGGAPVLAGLFGAATVIELSRLASDAGLTSGEGASFVQDVVEAVMKAPSVPEAVMAVLQATALLP